MSVNNNVSGVSPQTIVYGSAGVMGAAGVGGMLYAHSKIPEQKVQAKPSFVPAPGSGDSKVWYGTGIGAPETKTRKAALAEAQTVFRAVAERTSVGADGPSLADELYRSHRNLAHAFGGERNLYKALAGADRGLRSEARADAVYKSRSEGGTGIPEKLAGAYDELYRSHGTDVLRSDMAVDGPVLGYFRGGGPESVARAARSAEEQSLRVGIPEGSKLLDKDRKLYKITKHLAAERFDQVARAGAQKAGWPEGTFELDPGARIDADQAVRELGAVKSRLVAHADLLARVAPKLV